MATASLHLGHALAAIRTTLHNGPGRRVALWVQGCRLRCTRQCLNPHLLSVPDGEGTPVATIVERLRELQRDWGEVLEGLTVLGGEPSEQPEGLAALLAGARGLGLTTMVYSGHTLEALRQDTIHASWLEHTDLLVDGPYLPEEHDPQLPWRGSRNQRLLPLGPAYTLEALEGAARQQGKGFSISVEPDGRVVLSGFQERGVARDMERWVRGLSS